MYFTKLDYNTGVELNALRGARWDHMGVLWAITISIQAGFGMDLCL